MTSFQAFASVSWSLSKIVKDCFSPMIEPLGLSTVALAICDAHVLELQILLDQLGRVDLDADRRLLLAADAHQRNAEIWLMRWARMFSAASSTSMIGSTSELTDRIRIGVSDGLTLR